MVHMFSLLNSKMSISDTDVSQRKYGSIDSESIHKQPKWLPKSFSFQQVATQITVSTTIGCMGGILYAELYNMNKPATMFTTGSKWLAISVPFFTARELLFKLTDSKIITSTCSGLIIGGGIGMVRGGPRAVVPVSVLHGFGAMSIQCVFNLVDKFRIHTAIRKMQPAAEKNLIKIESAGNDPVKVLFNTTRDLILGLFGITNVPDCVKYATDIDYRKKQLLKLGILRTQIMDLKKELDELNIEY